MDETMASQAYRKGGSCIVLLFLAPLLACGGGPAPEIDVSGTWESASDQAADREG